jgi:FixJ family two-component response regulator
MAQGDDWSIKRHHGQHFTDAEREVIRKGFFDGRPAKDVARELQCSTRVIHTHYGLYRCETPVRHRTPAQKPKKRTASESRFYRSNFEPS